MLKVLTLLNKLNRVSRRIDADNFVAAPGIWVSIEADGSAKNVDGGGANAIFKMVIGNASGNEYESHDVKVGRITTLESTGIRCEVDRITSDNQGAKLTVDTNTGILKVAGSGEIVVATVQSSTANTTTVELVDQITTIA